MFITEQEIDNFSVKKLLAWPTNWNSRRITKFFYANMLSSTYPRFVAGFAATVISFLPRRICNWFNFSFHEMKNSLNQNFISTSSLEVSKMHLKALETGISQGRDCVLVLEDDVVLERDAEELISKLLKNLALRNEIFYWISLSGATSLPLSKLDTFIPPLGVYRIRNRSTRTTAAYLVSIDLAKAILAAVKLEGYPMRLPIDWYIALMLNNLKANVYWAEPGYFLHGSEQGEYNSNLDQNR